MYITMGTAVYGYISYEFLGLFEAVQCVPCNLAANGDQHAGVRGKTADTTSMLGKKSRGTPRNATLSTRPIPDPLFRRVDPEMGHTKGRLSWVGHSSEFRSISGSALVSVMIS